MLQDTRRPLPRTRYPRHYGFLQRPQFRDRGEASRQGEEPVGVSATQAQALQGGGRTHRCGHNCRPSPSDCYRKEDEVTTTKETRQAIRTRRKIARTFDAIQSHELNVSDVLHATPPCLRRLRVFDVVRRFPHLKGDGAENVLRKARVWPLTRMGNLTPEERDRILAHLPPRVKH
jgi:hypothetical protein